MIKNDKKASKKTAALMKKLTDEKLASAAGGFTIWPCLTCGLIHNPGGPI